MTQIKNDDLVPVEPVKLEEAESRLQEAANTAADVEEIDSSAPAVKPTNSSAGMTPKKHEPLPNPLLDDPYEWEQCTITIAYALLPDQTVSISIHNHKDEPLVKTFARSEVPLPDKISGVMATLQAIWPDSAVSATMVLLPKSADATERTIVVSVRAGNDTPIVQRGVESELPFPAPINTMLDELKALLPARALKRVEKDAKTKIVHATKPAARTASKPATRPATVAQLAANKTQLSLF